MNKRNDINQANTKGHSMIPKVSIIIPIYNMEKYIGRCLQSIVGQSFYDIEIICVDDCSPDNSLQIVQKYAKQDERIKIIKNSQNLKSGKTREAGFFASSGEYVSFIDADDSIDFNYIERLYDKARQTNADMVKADFMIFHNDGTSHIDGRANTFKQLLENGKSPLLANFHDLWSYLIKRELILDNKIMPDSINGDDCCGPRCLYHAKKVAVVDDVFYHYHYGQENAFSQQGAMSESSFDIRYGFISSQIRLANSFELDKQTYIAFIQQHLQNAYSCVEVVVANYGREEHSFRIINEFIRVINGGGGGKSYDSILHLDEKEKQRFVYDLIDETMVRGIKEKNADLILQFLLKNLSLKNAKSNKIIKMFAKIVSAFFITKSKRVKIRNAIINKTKYKNSFFVR